MVIAIVISPTNVISKFMTSNQKSRSNNRPGRHNKQNNRGKSNNNRGRKGPSKKQSQQPLTANKQIDSHGPSGKIRGNVKQLYDKYKALAHECRTKDRTSSEAYGQFAHHYYTLYSEFAAAEAAQQVEREKEKERKQQEAAENQSNVVSIVDEDKDTIEAITDEQDNEEQDAPRKNPARKTRAKKKSDDSEPELPLNNEEDAERPKRQRSRKKIKEEVAE